jgi:hypothetical protein
MGGPSLGWRAAFDELNASVTAEGLTRIRLQVRVLVDPSGSAADRASAVRLCSALPHCALAVADPGQWPQREADFAAQAAAAAALSIPSPGR